MTYYFNLNIYDYFNNIMYFILILFNFFSIKKKDILSILKMTGNFSIQKVFPFFLT